MANPYQIRYDVLAMAKDIADKNYEMQKELAWKMIYMAKDNSDQVMDAWKTYVPKAVTPEEIKEQADKLYEFVTKK